MNNKAKAFVRAARLRTLPLSISGILVGTAMVLSKGLFSSTIFSLSILTTIGFQILANFANDYGDGIKGTDNLHRVGPKRALQSGVILPREMKQAIRITTILTLIAMMALIYIAFGGENVLYTVLFTGLGIAAIVAAITYTVGKSAYGYHGFGDIFVFIFFGWIGVVGSYFLYSKELQWSVLLPATTIGLLSVAVLNLNNMRDRENDTMAHKNTVVVLLGASRAKYYHFCIIIMALLAIIIYMVITWQSAYDLIYGIAFLPIIMHMIIVLKNKDPKTLDPELRKLSLSTFLFSILFLIRNML